MGIFNFFFKKTNCPFLFAVPIAITSLISHHGRYVFWRPKMPAILSVLSKKSAISNHIGFMILYISTDKQGKTYLFHEMKPKIKTLTPVPSIERIYGRPF